MDKIKVIFKDHFEKIIFIIVALFCLYSLAGTFLGFVSSKNETAEITAINKEIWAGINKTKVIPKKTNYPYESEFKQKFEDTERFQELSASLRTRAFSEKTEVDPYDSIKDIISGHSNFSTAPAENCSNFFVRIQGENVCVVCGSKGEKDYTFKPATLTNSKVFEHDLPANPFVSRKEVKIIWEDNIDTDRDFYSERKAYVLRIEVTPEITEKINSDILDKASYQTIMRDLRREKKWMPILLDSGKPLELTPDNIPGWIPKKAISVKDVEEKANGAGLFDDEPEESVVAEPKIKNNSLDNKHKLHDEKVFYSFADNNIQPLKKYWYILYCKAEGLTATKAKKEAWKYSKPVEVITGAINSFFLSKVYPKRDKEGNEVLEGGKKVFMADLKVYQYFNLQDIFYEVNFKKLLTGDDIGSYSRKTDGKVINTKVSLRKSIKELLKGSDLSDPLWGTYKELFPNDLRARTAPLKVSLNCDTGYKIINIGEEEVTLFKSKRIRTKEYDDKGKIVYKVQKIPYKEVRGYIEVENILTKNKKKLYQKKTSEINSDLSELDIKTHKNN